MFLKFIFPTLSIFLLVLLFSFIIIKNLFKENITIKNKMIINQNTNNSMVDSSNSKLFSPVPTELFPIDKAKNKKIKNNNTDFCYTGEMHIEDIPIEEVFTYLLVYLYIKNLMHFFPKF